MKKLLFSLLLLLCATAVMAGPIPDGSYAVATLADLREAIANTLTDGGKTSDAKIKLVADIDISNLGSPLCDTFSGVIDGSYTIEADGEFVNCTHRIFGGITERLLDINPATGEEKVRITGRTRTTCSPLFNKLEHATIMNVEFGNIRVEDNDKEELGVIARSAYYTEFNDVNMNYCSVFCDENRAGTLVGYAQDCLFQLVRTSFCDVKVNGVEAGGLVGHSTHSRFESCFTSFDTSAYADGNNGKATAWCGGMVGYSSGDEFIGGINGTFVGADESRIGGFVGESVNSNFTGCQNQGTVAHIDYSDFEKKRYERNKALADMELSPDALGWVVGGTISGSIASAAIVSFMLSEGLRQSVHAFLFKHFLTSAPTLTTWNNVFTAAHGLNFFGLEYNPQTFVPLCTYAAVTLVVVAIAIKIAVTIYNGDDEVGGISSLARGGVFEQCQNYAELYCRDDNCGGIVGLGLGVTINNCANYGILVYNKIKTSGGILGKAEVNPNDDNKKCKVTNCFGLYGLHIVGTSGYDDGVDPTSGNNFRPNHIDSDAVSCEMGVDDYHISRGYVTIWLNQGIENRSKGIRPWHHGEVGEGQWKTLGPVLDQSKSEPQIADFKETVHIRTAADLIAFRDAVAENQFTCGVLEADITMGDEPWIPIGRDGFFTNFRGFFDGQGHTINGLKCESSEAVGLFGTVHSGAEIRNVIIGEDCEFTGTGNSGVGAIVGEVPIGWKWGNVVIENCGNLGSVTAAHNNTNPEDVVNAGGILGKVRNNTDDNVHVFVNNCFNMGTVTAAQGNSALLCGYMRNSGVVSNCWSAGQLRTSTPDVKPYDATQGHSEYFVGYWETLDMKNCFVVEKEANVDGTTIGSRQAGVDGYDAGGLTNGVITYLLNAGVVDGTQTWYQKLGDGGDLYPVLTKALDGTNMVFRYKDAEGYTRYGNTSREQISDVILGKKKFDELRVTDIDNTGAVDVADQISFVSAVNNLNR